MLYFTLALVLVLASVWKYGKTGKGAALILGLIGAAILLLAAVQDASRQQALNQWHQNPGSSAEQTGVAAIEALPAPQREAVQDLAQIDQLNSETARNYSEVPRNEAETRLLDQQARQVELDNVSTIGGALGITWHTLSQSSLAPCFGLLFLLTLVGAAFAGAFLWARLAGG